jgi:DNA-binding beta-propeller fold protein YncE
VPRRACLLAALALGLAVAGCGSAPVSELPAPFGASAPTTVRAGGGSLRAVLDPRARTVTLYAGATRRGSRPAGVAPAGLASNDGYRLYVADAGSDGLLIYRLRPGFVLERRLRLPGEPFALAADPARYRLYATLRARDRVVELPLHGRPHVLAAFATPHRPERVRVGSDGVLTVTGSDGARRRIDPRTATPTP